MMNDCSRKSDTNYHSKEYLEFCLFFIILLIKYRILRFIHIKIFIENSERKEREKTRKGDYRKQVRDGCDTNKIKRREEDRGKKIILS
jgi:hypothetical protein